MIFLVLLAIASPFVFWFLTKLVSPPPPRRPEPIRWNGHTWERARRGDRDA